MNQKISKDFRFRKTLGMFFLSARTFVFLKVYKKLKKRKCVFVEGIFRVFMSGNEADPERHRQPGVCAVFQIRASNLRGSGS
jgi:hypothetical protein